MKEELKQLVELIYLKSLEKYNSYNDLNMSSEDCADLIFLEQLSYLSDNIRLQNNISSLIYCKDTKNVRLNDVICVFKSYLTQPMKEEDKLIVKMVLKIIHKWNVK